MHQMPMDMMGPMMGWAWLLLWALFLAALVVGIVFLARALADGRTGSRRSASSALEILEERFARGEIDREDFEERKRVLES